MTINSDILISYALIFIGVMAWSVLLSGRHRIGKKFIDATTTFGGAFLFASCFINLVPHMYLEGYTTPNLGIKVGAAALVGFMIQLLLEQMTHGVEHGHNHNVCCEDHEHHPEHIHPMTGLMLGLYIHSFLEGMPMVDGEGDIHQGLLWGIILHNIPITLVLITLMMNNRFKLGKSLLLLAVFAVMTPLGSVLGLSVMSSNETLSCLMMGVVVGILLHVSVSILFDHDHNKFSWIKFGLILLAFIAAYFTPGCPEIYG